MFCVSTPLSREGGADFLFFFSFGLSKHEEGCGKQKFGMAGRGENLNDSWLLHRFLFNMTHTQGKRGKTRKRFIQLAMLGLEGGRSFCYLFRGLVLLAKCC
ncbi:hypothetical protein VTJ04DRAFT_7104 [Mycothermus thermophilus]|uniref:uncharacterized protein n=1 Tax=Humicola insolens TaxID=85995 RepID=UPI0037447F48